jgi:hypothetical protein
MRIRQLITACAATALLAAPATALAAGGPTPGPKASTKAKAKAYGKRCKHQSRKSAPGGSNFNRCTTAMAKIAKGKAGPKRACRTLSGTAARKRSPYGRCVVAGKKFQRQLSGDEQYTDPFS